MSDTDKSALIFLAENTAEKIQNIKGDSFKTLIACSAIFAFMLSNRSNLESIYNYLRIAFIIGCIFSIWLCGFHYPQKLNESRSKLRRVYDAFGEEFNKIRGDDNVMKNDIGDKVFRLLSCIYLVALILLLIGVHDVHRF